MNIKIRDWSIALLFITCLSVISACGNDNSKSNNSEDIEEDPGIETVGGLDAIGEPILVSIKNSQGDKIGEAHLEQKSNGVKIVLEAENLPPGLHGFHIHEKGVCEAPDFKSAGGHFNPTNASHGFDHPEGPHAGDLPNIEVAEDGTVQTEFLTDMVTLEGEKENSLFGGDGTALMIHSKADDYISQPAGDAGERIACGTIVK